MSFLHFSVKMCTFVRDLCLVARLKAEGIFKMTCRNTQKIWMQDRLRTLIL